MNGALGGLLDPWQPGLLRSVAEIARAGKELGVPVGVCGESAADPLLAMVFAGLGITSVSVSPAAVSEVSQALRSITQAEASGLSKAALAATTAWSAKQDVRDQLAI
jgi:phosphotransferase system enzyme I (PtsI)